MSHEPANPFPSEMITPMKSPQVNMLERTLIMKNQLLISLLALAASVSGHAAEATVAEEPVKLTESPVIEWKGKNNETLDAKIISGPLSIRLENCSGVVISCCDLGSISMTGCKDITIRNCYIHDAARRGVEISNSSKVRIEGCRIEHVSSGVYALNSQSIQVNGNFVRNVQGPMPQAQMAQYNKVTGPDNAVSGNYAINEHGKSKPEDVISIYQSTGTEASPILVEGNYLTGDPVDGNEGMSISGSGIMLGDGGGEHILCRKNVLISPGQVGVGVAGGRFVRVEANIIYGKQSNGSDCGLYVWNQSKKPSDHVTIVGNRVNWVSKTGADNSSWDAHNVDELEWTDNHFADATLPASLPAPPSKAPTPPKLWTSVNASGTTVARVPWKTK